MRPQRPRPAEGRSSILDRPTRVVAVVLLLFAAGLLLWSARRSAAKKVAGVADTSDELQGAAQGFGGAQAAGGSPSPGAPAPPPSARPPDPPPVIDGVTLEKTEVCSGEENLVTVHAHTVNGTDPALHYVIDGQMGQSVPVKLWRNDKGQVVGAHTLTVFGRGNVATTIPLPEYEVKDCRPTYVAMIKHRVRANTWADFDFEAQVIGVPPTPTENAPPPARPFKPVAYSWDFGDGAGVTTLGPLVEHGYEGRDQDTLYSYYVVSVTVRGAKGEAATGRVTLPLINPAYEAMAQKGLVQLLIALDPRFPELGSDGKVTQHVHLWHTQPAPVTIEHAILVKYYRQGAGQTRPQEVDVGQLLGSSTIPPGKEGITVTVTLDPSVDEEVFSKTWSLTGKSEDGHPVLGSFSVLIPPSRPSPDAGATVFDPALKQKIIAARQILGKDVVTDEDLWQLDREGMLRNLPRPTPDQVAAAASAAIADAVQKGPPTLATQQGRGAPVPTTTAAQAAPPATAKGAPATGAK